MCCAAWYVPPFLHHFAPVVTTPNSPDSPLQVPSSSISCCVSQAQTSDREKLDSYLSTLPEPPLRHPRFPCEVFAFIRMLAALGIFQKPA